MTRPALALACVTLLLAACGPGQPPEPPEAPPAYGAGGALAAQEAAAASALTEPASATPSAAPPPAAVAAASHPEIAALPPPFNAADHGRGQQIYNQCGACHLIEAGGGNRLGPNLHGVVGRKAAALADFAYSPAMKESGVTWSAAELDKFLADPRGAMPGNRMTYPGLRKPEDRRDLIGYMAVESQK